MIDKDKIRNIIELFIAWNGETEVIDIANIDSAVEFISSSLQEEPVSEELEEVCNQMLAQARISKYEAGNPFFSDGDYKLGFKNGAKWQKQQDQSTIELAEDHAMFAGMEKMKEEMMAKAIDAEVLENYDGKVIKYDETILDEKLSDCKVFDKVKVIIIKED